VTKFDDLCSAYASANVRENQHRQDAYSFAGELAQRYKGFLEIPDDCFQLWPTDKEIKGGMKYTPMGAVHLGEDSFWHLGLILTFSVSPGTYPKQQIMLHFRFKEVAEKKYLITISEDGGQHTLTCGVESEFNTFFEFLQKELAAWFNDGLKRFLNQDDSSRHIGFV